MAFDQKLVDELARAQVSKQQYLAKGRKDLADNADRYRNQVAQQLANQGFKIDPNVDLTDDYIKKHGDGFAGKYDTSQKGQVAYESKRSSSGGESRSSSRPPSFDDDLAASLARSKLEFDPFRQELRVDEASGRKYLPTLTALQFLSGQRQQQYANASNDRSFAYGKEQDALANDRAERAFTAQQQQQAYANRQAEMERNIGLAESFAQRYGVTIDPKSDYRYLNSQVAGLKPLAVQQMDAEERSRQAAERARQQGISLDWARLSDSRAGRATDDARQASQAEQKRLMDVWQLTGKAPAGIPGVEPGTPLYEGSPKSAAESSYDEAMAKAISFANQDPDWSMLDANGRKQLIQDYYDQISTGDPPSDEDLRKYLSR